MGETRLRRLGLLALATLVAACLPPSSEFTTTTTEPARPDCASPILVEFGTPSLFSDHYAVFTSSGVPGWATIRKGSAGIGPFEAADGAFLYLGREKPEFAEWLIVSNADLKVPLWVGEWDEVTLPAGEWWALLNHGEGLVFASCEEGAFTDVELIDSGGFHLWTPPPEE